MRHSDLVVAQTRQTDVATGVVTCTNLTGEDFSVSLDLSIEYCAYRTSLTTCVFLTGFSTAEGLRGNGSVTVVARLVGTYDDTDPAVGKVRRVFACARTSASPSSCQTYDYSATYGF